MENTQKQRKTQLSTTCFLECDGKFLFVHRTKKGNSSDHGLFNGVGGKLEAGEDFLSCALREVHEETGYEVREDHTRLSAIVSLSGGYPEDWVMCFFMMQVPSRHIPVGAENAEGTLHWLSTEEILSGTYPLVADIPHLWLDLLNPDKMTFFSAVLSEAKQIEHFHKSSIKTSTVLNHVVTTVTDSSSMPLSPTLEKSVG